MAHVTHTHPVGHGLSALFSRVGAGLARFGERLMEARQRQANAIVREHLRTLSHIGE